MHPSDSLPDYIKLPIGNKQTRLYDAVKAVPIGSLALILEGLILAQAEHEIRIKQLEKKHGVEVQTTPAIREFFNNLNWMVLEGGASNK